MDVLGRLGAEGAGELDLEVGAREEVLAADDVRDPEVEVVDDGGELIGRPSVGAHERGVAEAQGALGVGGADTPRRLQVPVRALALPHRALVPGDPEPLEVAEDLLLGAGRGARDVGVVDPQDERAAALVREPAVDRGRQRAAEVQRPCRARREAHPDHAG